MKHGTTHKTTKGYPRITAGPLRNQYVHRIVAAALIGRELSKDEEVHHKDADKLNPKWDNLMILGEKDHSWVSAKQAFYMRCIKEPADKAEWEEFMDEQARLQKKEIDKCRVRGVPLEVMDGTLRQAWEDEQ